MDFMYVCDSEVVGCWVKKKVLVIVRDVVMVMFFVVTVEVCPGAEGKVDEINRAISMVIMVTVVMVVLLVIPAIIVVW